MTDAGHFWIYFDIETTGTNPEQEKIIAIQYQTLSYGVDGKRNDHQIGDCPPPTLTILKEWESDEKTILQKAYDELLSPANRSWFEPAGNILSFEGKFLKARLKKHGIIGPDEHLRFGQLNVMDLRPLMILINEGEYSTAKFFGKVGDNQYVPYWYQHKEYDKIENYVREEAHSFAKTLDYLVLKLPQLKNEILALHS